MTRSEAMLPAGDQGLRRRRHASRPHTATGVERYAEHFARLFRAEPVVLGAPYDGTIGVLSYVHGGVASVVSLGLSDRELPGGARVELLCEVLEDHAPAAEVAIRIAIRRVLGELGARPGPLGSGDVWINAVPIISGTNMQGMIALDPSWHVRDDVVRDEAGDEYGIVQEIVMLTTTEARRIAHDGFEAFRTASAATPAARLDVLRGDLVGPPATLPDVACIVTRHLHEAPVGWLQRDLGGQFLATSLTESEADLADPATFETWPLRAVVGGTPELRAFAIRAQPGDYARREPEGWRYGRLAGADEDA